MNNAPCKGCADRHEGCHSACAHYQDYCREREAYRKARSYEASIGSYVQETAVRVRDRQGKSFRPSARRQER